jgi:hypothetical protein
VVRSGTMEVLNWHGARTGGASEPGRVNFQYYAALR